MQFYGFHNQYGRRTTFNGKYKGELHVFKSRTDRDDWVAEDKANRFAPKVDHDVVRQYKGKAMLQASAHGAHSSTRKMGLSATPLTTMSTTATPKRL